VFRSASTFLQDRPTRLAVAVLVVGVGLGLGLPAVLDTTAPAPVADHAHAGPAASDYLPISAAPTTAVPVPGPAASTGTFTIGCGRNLDGHRNSDNFIASPGVQGGAHHVHDYVGNTSTDRNSTDASLAAAGTTCALGDRSTFYWPVLRDTRDASDLGRILTPEQVEVTLRGNPQGPVAGMPEFLRASVGDAMAVTDGPTDTGRVRWTCSGTPDRATTTHYPLCPAGQLVERIADYPACWDGRATNDVDYRTHVVFGDPDTGACPAGTNAVPQLRITVGYRVPAGRSYAIDTFPNQLRAPVADHFDFENVMPASLMRRVVECINGGRQC
jgi:Domain of unknown function (DUF1996)